MQPALLKRGGSQLVLLMFLLRDLIESFCRRSMEDQKMNAALNQIQDQLLRVRNELQDLHWQDVCREFESLVRLADEIEIQFDCLPDSYIELLDDLDTKLRVTSCDKKLLKAMCKPNAVAFQGLQAQVETALATAKRSKENNVSDDSSSSLTDTNGLGASAAPRLSDADEAGLQELLGDVVREGTGGVAAIGQAAAQCSGVLGDGAGAKGASRRARRERECVTSGIAPRVSAPPESDEFQFFIPHKIPERFLLSPEQSEQRRSVSRPTAFSQAHKPKDKSRTTSYAPNLEDLPASQREQWVVPNMRRNPVVRGVEVCRHFLPRISISSRFDFA
jgi:hypothetical protein